MTTLYTPIELTVSTVDAVRAEWISALGDEPRPEVEVELSATTMIDTAGLQLIMSLRKEVAARAGTAHLNGATPEALRLATLYGETL